MDLFYLIKNINVHEIIEFIVSKKQSHQKIHRDVWG